MKIIRAVLLSCAIGLIAAPATTLAGPSSIEAEQKRANLIQYAPEEDLNELAKGGKTIVFFFATWCPNCILTLTELSEKWSELDPELTLIIADYDTDTALKATYGVTYQDTFVLLDKDAKAAKRWNAGGVAGINKNLAAQ